MIAETESPVGAGRRAVEPVASPTQPADGDRRAVPPRLSWDVKRPAASCFVAGRSKGFSDVDCRAAVLASIRS
jgi:Uncharacterized protein conserved in bacteria (DUF2252)